MGIATEDRSGRNAQGSQVQVRVSWTMIDVPPRLDASRTVRDIEIGPSPVIKHVDLLGSETCLGLKLNRNIFFLYLAMI